MLQTSVVGDDVGYRYVAAFSRITLDCCDTGEVQGTLVVGFQKNANKMQPSHYSLFCLMSCVWGIFANTQTVY